LAIGARPPSPLAAAHVHLGVVDTECLDLDDDLPGDGLRLWQLLVDEAVRPAELLDDDRAHAVRIKHHVRQCR